LEPRQATIGGKPRLLGITKRGSRCLRKNLIQAARSSLPAMSNSDSRLERDRPMRRAPTG